MPGIAARYRLEVPPAFQPRPRSLLTGVPVLPLPDVHAENGVAWDPPSCSPPEAWAITCETSTEDKLADGTDPHGPAVEADPFVVFGAAQCSAVGGFSSEELQAQARAKLVAGESYVVERAYLEGTFGQAPSLQGATDATPAAGALSPAGAVATLEGFLAENAVGRGTILAPPAAAPYLAAYNLFREGSGGQLATAGNGTGLVFGAGFTSNMGPDGIEAPAGEAWLYAVAGLTVYRGEVETYAARSPRTNDVAAIAERTYALGHECGPIAVRMTLTC